MHTTRSSQGRAGRVPQAAQATAEAWGLWEDQPTHARRASAWLMRTMESSVRAVV